MHHIDEFISIIPIRAGSKGLPGKNIKPLKGIPLYKHTLFQSLRLFKRTIISTDINSVINEKHTESTLILKRPKHLSSDTTEMKDVLLDIFQNNNLSKNIIVLLQATSPLRKDIDILEAIKIYQSGKFSMVMSVNETNSTVLKYGFISDKEFISLNNQKYIFSNRQHLPKVFKPNGAIYIFSVKDFLNNNFFPDKSIGSYQMPIDRSIDIDTEQDLLLVEKFL